MARKSASAAGSARKAATPRTRRTAGRAAAGGMSPGICRVEQESTRTFGYVVRLGHKRTPRGWRPKFTAYFGDFSHGGKKEALAAAERWVRTVNRTGKAPSRK